MSDLEALLAKATPGPWAYRPYEHDDWGFIRGPEVQSSIGLVRPVVALGRDGVVDGAVDHNEHRRNGTDPYGPNAALIVAMRNELPAILSQHKAMREALERIADANERQADCLIHYAEQDGHAAKPVPSVYHLQAMHFCDFATEVRTVLASLPPAPPHKD